MQVAIANDAILKTADHKDSSRRSTVNLRESLRRRTVAVAGYGELIFNLQTLDAVFRCTALLPRLYDRVVEADRRTLHKQWRGGKNGPRYVHVARPERRNGGRANQSSIDVTRELTFPEMSSRIIGSAKVTK